jgi:hypothetical protein
MKTLFIFLFAKLLIKNEFLNLLNESKVAKLKAKMLQEVNKADRRRKPVKPWLS